MRVLRNAVRLLVVLAWLIAPALAAPGGASGVYPLNAVSPGAAGPWHFYAASAGVTDTKEYVPVRPGIDAANVVRVMAEASEPFRPRMEWEYGYAAGLVSLFPESDRNVSSKKGDLIVVWQSQSKGKYRIQVDVDNVGTDVQGGDGGTILFSRLTTGAHQDTNIVERVAVPASGFQSPHVRRRIAIDAAAGDRVLMRLNAGIDGFADQWRIRYVITRAATKN